MAQYVEQTSKRLLQQITWEPKVYIGTRGYSRNNGFPVEFVGALKLVKLFFNDETA